MSNLHRPVDQAMAELRPEKMAIRHLWVDEVRRVVEEYPNSEVPWYLTLSGGEGQDIQLLIEEGLISTTEVDSIAQEDQHRIVAVERNSRAIADLQRRFAGLWIKEADFQNLVRGEGQFSWPQGEDYDVCRARVVNLDLNTPLKGRRDEGRIVFPVLEWIRKLCQVHSRPPRTDWTLLLTLHGEAVWPEEVNEWTQGFLLDNMGREPYFAESCRAFLGKELCAIVTQDDGTDWTELEREVQQRLIMVMVPKIISQLVHNQGWRVRTQRNLAYGGGDVAGMTTWVLEFTSDEDAVATPDSLYRAALRDILEHAGVVDEDGTIHQHDWPDEGG